jgi:hypothetical protein
LHTQMLIWYASQIFQACSEKRRLLKTGIGKSVLQTVVIPRTEQWKLEFANLVLQPFDGRINFFESLSY